MQTYTVEITVDIDDLFYSERAECFKKYITQITKDYIAAFDGHIELLSISDGTDDEET